VTRAANSRPPRLNSIWFATTALAATLLALSGCRSGSPNTGTLPSTNASAILIGTAAVKSPEVAALIGARRVTITNIGSWFIAGKNIGAQITVKLTDGSTTITGSWPRLVVDNPASCETCKTDGPLRWHFESSVETHNVDGLLVGYDTKTSTVAEIIPLLNGAPSNAPARAPQLESPNNPTATKPPKGALTRQ
jgi:hypothetical protein